MSVFGGDSWAREAQQRKRRVDDLILSSSNSSDFKKLSSGKYACLVCPHNPVLDSPLALSMHIKGSRHIAAETRLKERELSRQQELNKRIALLADSTAVSNSGTSTQELKGSRVTNKPLIKETWKAILETQCNKSDDQNAKVGFCSTKTSIGDSPCHSESPLYPQSISSEKRSEGVTEAAGKLLKDWNEELHMRREKELKFTAAGWKRDGYGKWYRDENVEFDSDEEDPNDCPD